MKPRAPTPLRRFAQSGLLLLAFGGALPLAAQTWPARPVSLVVGTPAGGAVDAFARTLGDELNRQTGGTILVENRAGANGNLAAEQVRKAAPDGHTLWVSTQAMFTINPSAYPALRWQQSDFKPIAKGVESPLVLVVHPSVPVKQMSELGPWLKANPDKAVYASFSPGTPSHFLGFQLGERLKVPMVHVPYKGSAPQTTDLLGGQVPLGFAQLQTSLPHLQSGKLRALAVTSPQRSRYLPQVPTLAELGYEDLNATVWFGLMAPAGTPAATIEAISAAMAKAQANPEYRAKLEAQGFDVPKESGAAFEKGIAAETARWAQLVKATGFKAND